MATARAPVPTPQVPPATPTDRRQARPPLRATETVASLLRVGGPPVLRLSPGAARAATPGEGQGTASATRPGAALPENMPLLAAIGLAPGAGARAAPVLPIGSASQTPAVTRPSEASPSAQPAAPTPSGRDARIEPSATPGPAISLPPVGDSPTRQKEGPSSTTMGRIAASPKSAVQAQVAAQAQLVTDDCARSESQIARSAATRRQQLNSQFSGARGGLSEVFTRSIASVQQFVESKQAEVTGAVASALAWIRGEF